LMTRGTSGTVETWWPRARRRDGTEEAAKAETVANRLRKLGLIFGELGGEMLTSDQG
jgi:hypothetical protein